MSALVLARWAGGSHGYFTNIFFLMSKGFSGYTYKTTRQQIDETFNIQMCILDE